MKLHPSPLVYNRKEIDDLVARLKETSVSNRDAIPYPCNTTGTLEDIRDGFIHASLTCLEAGEKQNPVTNLGEVMTYFAVANTQVIGARIDNVGKTYVSLMYKCLIFQNTVIRS